MGRIPAHPPTETFKALADNLGSLLSVFNLILTQQEEEKYRQAENVRPSVALVYGIADMTSPYK
jgi:hypothetical protein